MATSLIFELGFALPDAEPAAPGQPFKLLLLGDFSGGANPLPPARRKARRLDIDNFDQELARMAPSVQVTLDDGMFAVQPKELDDFHPDQLYQKSHALADLRAQRERLRNPATFAQAAAELTGQPLPASPAVAPQAQDSAASSHVDRLVRQLVGALPSGPDPRQADYVAAADSVIAARMRALLHDPRFQAVEAAWRGAHWLTTSLELDDELQLHILDIGADELRANPQALHQVLVDDPRSGADGQPWSLLCCLHAFGHNDADLNALSALGALAAQAGAPLLAAHGGDGGDGGGAGVQQWNALRATPQAHWIGMAALRLLLRLPYGKATDPVTAFAFEEADAGFKHEHYLWGAGSLACACVLAQAFRENGWDMTPGDVLDLAGLPAHVTVRDGESHLQPCSEVLLNDQGVDAALKLGLMPLVSHRQRAAVRLPRIQSIALPAAPLSGPWQA